MIVIASGIICALSVSMILMLIALRNKEASYYENISYIEEKHSLHIRDLSNANIAQLTDLRLRLMTSLSLYEGLQERNQLDNSKIDSLNRSVDNFRIATKILKEENDNLKHRLNSFNALNLHSCNSCEEVVL